MMEEGETYRRGKGDGEKKGRVREWVRREEKKGCVLIGNNGQAVNKRFKL